MARGNEAPGPGGKGSMEDGGEMPEGERSENTRREPSEWALSIFSAVSQRRCFLSSQYFSLVGDLAWRA